MDIYISYVSLPFIFSAVCLGIMYWSKNLLVNVGGLIFFVGISMQLVNFVVQYNEFSLLELTLYERYVTQIVEGIGTQEYIYNTQSSLHKFLVPYPLSYLILLMLYMLAVIRFLNVSIKAIKHKIE